MLLDMKLNAVNGLQVLREIKEQYPHLRRKHFLA